MHDNFNIFTMKRFLALIILAGLVLFITQSFTTIPGYEGKIAAKTVQIDINGDFDSGQGLRSGGDIITAELQGGVIMALFHRNIGIIQVTLTNDGGDTVYEVIINTSIQQQLFIPISGLPSDVYTISFNNNLGAMYGDFHYIN